MNDKAGKHNAYIFFTCRVNHVVDYDGKNERRLDDAGFDRLLKQSGMPVVSKRADIR
jgi:hypothetical protein